MTANKNTGFSMIELMITLAIIGIITVIALPGYQRSQLQAARAEAKTTLLEVASLQERFYSVNTSYSTNANPLASPAQATVTSTNGKYVVSVAACGSGITNCFLATATPQGSQTNDECGNLTLSSLGARGSSAGVAADCWQR